MPKKNTSTAPAPESPAPESPAAEAPETPEELKATKLLSVSPDTGTAIAEWAMARAGEEVTRIRAIDLMYAEGLRPHHCVDRECPEGSPERGIYLEITARIKAGLLARRPEWAAALAVPTKARTAAQKEAAADAQAAVGPYRANLRKALLGRCEAEKAAAAAAAAQEVGEESEAAAPAKRGFDCAKFREQVATWIKRLSKNGIATDFERDAALALIKDLQVKITVK